MGWLASPPAARSFVASIGATEQRIAAFDGTMDRTAIREAGEKMLARHATFGMLPDGIVARPAYLAVRNLQTLDWRLMLVLPRAELLAEARALLERQLFLGAVGLVVLMAAIWLVAAGIARPIRALSTAVGAVDADDAELALPATRRADEIGVLTDALRRMQRSLQRHIQLRAESLAERARMEQELAIAAGIQQSMLPRRDAAIDLPAAIEVAAALRPAKQVGGDLYDYFTTGDGNVFFAIGDVSDKGIPAALFMARMSALLRVLGAAGAPPDRLLAEINTRLVDGNDACMFVTLGCGVLDVRTGRIRYASAGHEPPFVRNAEGTVRPLPTANGAALGIDDGAAYPVTEGFLAPGDTLVLFTDGLSEAEAPDGGLFGVERVSALLGDARDGGADALVRAVVDTVGTEASGFRATDDLTVLALGFRPPDVTAPHADDGARWRIAPEATAEGIRLTQHRLDAILAARDVDRERRDDVELITEELLTNVVRAAESAGREVRLAIECTLTPSEIVLAFRDDGARFDPTARATPRLDADIADREVGGLGILIVQRLADTCRYTRMDGENVLEVRLHRNSDETNRGVPCH
jgi:sigma-B regulation protein RsbU (phosphoserine phosphatase)